MENCGDTFASRPPGKQHLSVRSAATARHENDFASNSQGQKVLNISNSPKKKHKI